MIRRLSLAAFACTVAATAHADCDLLNLEDAELVLGPNVSDLSGDDAEFQCFFLGGSPQGTLIVQFGDRDYYENTSILQPHTPVDIGEEGRSNVDTNGVTAVQFVQSDTTVTMSVRPSSESDRDYLDALATVGRRVAERLD
ncbi:MAG: hypothetical protein PVF50_06135 [Gammaproteobacteria bacterium]|jgi:hypothetical protein